jgi:hypothetical protein
MIDEFAPDGSDAATALTDVPRIEALLQEAARAGHTLSYSEVLMMIGLRFTRPKMRALCKVLDKIDERGAARGEPALAVLVVRESDRLPGQGWWSGRTDYAGDWTGPAAAKHVQKLQSEIFAFWR